MRKPLAFITGVAGFAGSHLAEELLNHGYRVAGTLLRGEPVDNIRPRLDDIDLVEADILSEQKLNRVIGKFQPDYIFHLAAFSSVGRSFRNERLVYRVNFYGTLNVLQAALTVRKLRKFVFVSSSDCYGRFTPATRALTEDQPFNPVSPYGVSKAAGEYLCRSYVKWRELPVTIARSFNHSGPRQSEHFVIPSFARQIAAIEKGRAEPVMLVGDLSVRRDISDVRDIVCGYRL
ncbi:MAG: GDP-mannose 4,6-dehydratase, partial [Candidatus Zixiibacteriota bacterium]